MEFRKMLMITLYAKQKKRHRRREQSFGFCGRRRGWEKKMKLYIPFPDISPFSPIECKVLQIRYLKVFKPQSLCLEHNWCLINNYWIKKKKESRGRTSLVVQWLIILLPVEGTWVQSLAWGYFTCYRAAQPVCHQQRGHALEPVNRNCWAWGPWPLEPGCSGARALQQEKPVQWETHAPQL